MTEYQQLPGMLIPGHAILPLWGYDGVIMVQVAHLESDKIVDGLPADMMV